MKKVIDTNILLEYPEIILTEDCIIPSTVISELENIKTSGNKSEEIRFKARQATRFLSENQEKYSTFVTTTDTYDLVDKYKLPIDNDNLIIACCKQLEIIEDNVILISNDLCMRLIAKDIFKIKVKSYKTDKTKELYKGFKEVVLSDDKLAYFYEHQTENQFENLINEYLIIDDKDSNPIDAYKWTNDGYQHLSDRGIRSETLGSLKPLDYYQNCAFDSVNKNDFTVLFGRAGAGKTSIPLYYLQSQLEKGKIKKIYIIYHFETLKNAKTLCFVKGNQEEKILNTASIGGILASKYGDMLQVARMIQDGVLEIIPTANIRGVELNDCGLLVTEAQDIDTYTLKTIIQRCGKNVKCCFEGDILEQSDINCGQLGLDRMIEVFKGYEKFGCVKLKNSYRSPICELADKLTDKI